MLGCSDVGKTTLLSHLLYNEDVLSTHDLDEFLPDTVFYDRLVLLIVQSFEKVEYYLTKNKIDFDKFYFNDNTNCQIQKDEKFDYNSVCIKPNNLKNHSEKAEQSPNQSEGPLNKDENIVDHEVIKKEIAQLLLKLKGLSSINEQTRSGRWTDESNQITPKQIDLLEDIWADRLLKRIVIEERPFDIPESFVYFANNMEMLRRQPRVTLKDKLLLPCRTTGKISMKLGITCSRKSSLDVEEKHDSLCGSSLNDTTVRTRNSSLSSTTSGDSDYLDLSYHCKLTFVDFGGKRSERKKWDRIIRSFKYNELRFCFVGSCIDQVLKSADDFKTNRLTEALKEFEKTTRMFGTYDFLLILTKVDLLDKYKKSLLNIEGVGTLQEYKERLKRKYMNNYKGFSKLKIMFMNTLDENDVAKFSTILQEEHDE